MEKTINTLKNVLQIILWIFMLVMILFLSYGLVVRAFDWARV